MTGHDQAFQCGDFCLRGVATNHEPVYGMLALYTLCI